MNIDTIIKRHEQLNSELRAALATMERSDRVKEIRDAIKENQQHCPHYSAEYNWAITSDCCPYCGFKFQAGGEMKDADCKA